MVRIPMNSFEHVEIFKYYDGSVLLKHTLEGEKDQYIAFTRKQAEQFAVAFSEYAGVSQ